MQFFLILALVIILALVFFALQNSTVITLTFLVWEYTGSLAFIIALTFAAGILTGILLTVPSWWRKTRAYRASRRRLKELEQELSRAGQEGPRSSPEKGVEG